MSDENQELMDALQQEPEVQEEVEQEPDLTDYGRRYVATIEDEQERALVDRHIRRWDAGHAKEVAKWESFKSQYEPLGSPDDLRIGRQLFDMLQTDPGRLANHLYEMGVYPTIAEAKEAVEDQKEIDPTTEKLTKMEAALNALAQEKLHEREQMQQQRQIEQFKSDLAKAKKELGDFDEQMVIRLIAGGPEGTTIEAAVKEYQSHFQTSVNKNARKQAPSLLGSSGAAPTHKPADYGKMTNKETSNFLAELLNSQKDS